jgi:uncharacterized protein (TIGR03085 family)
VTRFASLERAGLADLLLQTGPDAPTLCQGWTTRDLAAHLVVRASRPDAAVGVVFKPLARHTDRLRNRVAEQDWERLVAQVRRRPTWAIFGEEAVNQAEYFVHHEDIRRARPGWQPRSLPPELSASLWSRLHLQSKLTLRRIPATIRVSAPGFGTFTAGRGGPEVTMTGEPQELVMFMLGRQAHARVDLAGPDDLVERLRTARFGV